MKQNRKPRLWDIVQIDWLDSMHTTTWRLWDEHDWANEAKMLRHKSSGYVAAMTRDSVTIVQSFNDSWKNEHPSVVDAIMTIPRCAITKITVLARRNKLDA